MVVGVWNDYKWFRYYDGYALLLLLNLGTEMDEIKAINKTKTVARIGTIPKHLLK